MLEKNNFWVTKLNASFLKIAFVIVIGLLSCTWSFAQTPQYYNYENVGSSSNTFPFGQSGGKMVQYLIGPGEINQPTAFTGGLVTDIYIYFTTATNRVYTDFVVAIAQDTITGIPDSTFYTGSLDTVLSVVSFTMVASASSWGKITLANPFNYDPTKSLIVSISQCSSTGTGGNVRQNSMTTGPRRVWSDGGCPFVPYFGSDFSLVNFGIDFLSLTIDSVQSTNLSCNGSNDGLIIVSATGDSASLQYSVDSGAVWQTNDSFPNLAAGTYNVMVKDSSGVELPYGLNPITLTEPPLSLTFITDTVCEYLFFNGINIYTSGIYYDTLVNTMLCDSFITLDLLVIDPKYAGEDSTAQICSNISPIVDLFIYLSGSYDTTAAYWNDDDLTSQVSGNYFNAGAVTQGATYHFTYIVPGDYPCSNDSATITLMVDDCSGISESNLQDIRIYPNPVKEKLTISGASGQTVIISDIAARVLQTIMVDNDLFLIDFSEYASGSYFLRIKGSESFGIYKVIRE